MPLLLEARLRREAAAKRLKGKRRDAYVYGGLRQAGWKPKRRKRRK